jgi:hypothetical protein
MRYQVPQFIEVEDKIFGPLTMKQFLYIAGGAALAFVFWTILPSLIAPIVAIPVFILFMAFAFKKYNGRPLIFSVEHGVKYYLGKKLYVWKKKDKKAKVTAAKAPSTNPDNPAEALMVPKLSDSKLKEISWSLDINENVR